MSLDIPFTVTAIAAAIADGTTTAENVAEEVLQRCKGGAHLNAIIAQDPDALLAAARAADQQRRTNQPLGPLHGVPILIKDNIDTSDLPTSGGTPALEHDTPRHNAPVVQRLMDAGALIAGKANLYELAMGGTSINHHFGSVLNPWQLDHTPGGSSSGSAAAVAARMVPGALGTDMMGSVRAPCSFTGIAGLRPSYQRYPFGGVVPSTRTHDAVGIMANSTPDLALLDQVLSGHAREQAPPEHTSLEGLRLGRPRGEFYRLMADATAKVIEAAVAQLQDAGAVIVEVDLPEIVKLTAQTSRTISAYEVPLEMPPYLERRGTSITVNDIVTNIASPMAAERFHADTDNLAAFEPPYRKAMDEYRPQLQQILQSYFTEHDVAAMIFPTTPFTAPEITEDLADLIINGQVVKQGFSQMINNTLHQTVTGIPSMVVPAGLTDDGLPVGLSFDGPMGSDQRLIAIGNAFERARGEFARPVNR